MENYHIVLKVNLKKLQTLRTALFASHKQGTDMLRPTWTIAGIWDFHYVFDYFSKNRIVERHSFFVNDGCEIDLSAWQQQLENSYHKFNLGVTSRSAEPTHPHQVLPGFHGTHPPSSMMSLCNEPLLGFETVSGITTPGQLRAVPGMKLFLSGLDQSWKWAGSLVLKH